MPRIIISKYDSVCADKNCGAFLPAGSRIRYYGRGRVYGVDCHDRNGRIDNSDQNGRDYGVYSSDGRKIGSTCNCEDYPCCGH